MPKPKSKPATDSRSAIDGRFVPKSKAKSDPATTVTTRRKVKAKLMWGVQSPSGEIGAAFKMKVNAEAFIFIYGADNPKSWRVVRVRIEVVDV